MNKNSIHLANFIRSFEKKIIDSYENNQLFFSVNLQSKVIDITRLKSHLDEI